MDRHRKVVTKCSINKRRSAAGISRVAANWERGSVVKRWKGLWATSEESESVDAGISRLLIALSSRVAGAAKPD
jgi:hypothetical protein